MLAMLMISANAESHPKRLLRLPSIIRITLFAGHWAARKESMLPIPAFYSFGALTTFPSDFPGLRCLTNYPCLSLT